MGWDSIAQQCMETFTHVINIRSVEPILLLNVNNFLSYDVKLECFDIFDPLGMGVQAQARLLSLDAHSPVY